MNPTYLPSHSIFSPPTPCCLFSLIGAWSLFVSIELVLMLEVCCSLSLSCLLRALSPCLAFWIYLFDSSSLVPLSGRVPL